MGSDNNYRSDVCRAAPIFIGVVLFWLAWSPPGQANLLKPGQKENVTQPTLTDRTQQNKTSETATRITHGFRSEDPVFVGGTLSQMPDPTMPIETTWMEFNLDWTTCRNYRVSDESPIDIALSGHMSSTRPVIWNLRSTSPGAAGPPGLRFIQDALGRTGPEFGTDIPLTWEIAVDNGPFGPITVLPDNSLRVVLPLGIHTFRVRITSPILSYAHDGYYQLKLDQSVTPGL